MRVAVVGAGVAGLVMCHRMVHCSSHDYEVTVFEQMKDIGGTWIYTDNVGLDEHGYPIHSSMYDNLVTNLPKELMAFIDFPFPDDGSPSYVTRQQVLQYLHDYCDHFHLRKHIKFESRVIEVQPIDCGNSWQLEIENVNSKDKWTEQFDRIIVCNGHYATPRYPEIEGLDKFQGEIVHSHNYRVPDKYAGMNVLCIGAGSSGVDIVLDVAPIANQAVLSHNLSCKLGSPFPDNVREFPWITQVTQDGFTFKNGQFFRTDVLIVCTGYEYHFPFLTPECCIEVKEHSLVELYKHMINIKYPSMAYLNVPFTTVPFVVADVQAQCLAKVMADLSTLPTASQMLQDTLTERQARLKRGNPARHFHKFSFMIWDYLYMLEFVFGGIPQPLPKWKEKLHNVSFRNRSRNFMTFRNLNYRIRDDCVYYR